MTKRKFTRKNLADARRAAIARGASSQQIYDTVDRFRNRNRWPHNVLSKNLPAAIAAVNTLCSQTSLDADVEFPADVEQSRLILPPEVSDIAGKIQELHQRTCEGMIEIGRLLIEAKDCLGHGEWGGWLRREFAWPQDTAENFIHVAEVFENIKSETFRSLDFLSLYLLARPSTSAAARDQILKLIEGGARPSVADMKRIIRNAKALREWAPRA